MPQKFLKEQTVANLATGGIYRIGDDPHHGCTMPGTVRPAYRLQNFSGESIGWIAQEEMDNNKNANGGLVWMLIESKTDPVTEVTYPIKFQIGDTVEHLKTGGLYQITGLPDKNVLEATREPSYAYLMPDGRTCHRCQREMEDGRFVHRPDLTLQ